MVVPKCVAMLTLFLALRLVARQLELLRPQAWSREVRSAGPFSATMLYQGARQRRMHSENKKAARPQTDARQATILRNFRATWAAVVESVNPRGLFQVAALLGGLVRGRALALVIGRRRRTSVS